MTRGPLVSVIITTRNEAKTLERLLLSIASQTYSNIEIIVVDNNSQDKTKRIASQYTKFIFNKGPERSAQRNFGAKKAKGSYYLMLDADMVLEKHVLSDCVNLVTEQPAYKAVIIPEKSVGIGFWAQAKALERQCYVGDDTIEAARFFEKRAFQEAGGYDEVITGPEDWDLPQKIKKSHPIGRIKSAIIHHEGHLTLAKLARKKFYYGKKVAPYIAKHPVSTTTQQLVYLLRPAFYKHWKLLLQHPGYFLGMLCILGIEQCAGFIGYLYGRIRG
jgi:glycosyltransferase involved in cell wall biosynthesis